MVLFLLSSVVVMTLKTKGKGNLKAQNKRRRQRMKNLPPYQKDKYQLIDDNFTHYPVAYCTRYKGWLSVGLMDVHGCEKRQCVRLRKEQLNEE